MRSASPNTTSMSCSVIRNVYCVESASCRTSATTARVSSGVMPAVGSSSSTRRGRVASTIAISSNRLSP